MEEYDDTASPNDESLSENDDSEFEPNISLSGNSFSDNSDIDISDSNSSSLREVNVLY